MKQFDIQKLDTLVTEGKLMMQTHPTLPLRIYKYTKETQFGKLWDEVTSTCRGLVVDNAGFQYSNPIPKFFNLEELKPEEIPIHLSYEVFDKVDGSCIEVFYYGGKMVVCTLGSFMSDQALLATSLLKGKYSNLTLKHFRPGNTYIFELLAPENKIVLDHGTEQKLVLITVRNNDTGEESLPDIGFSVVEKINSTIDQLIVEKQRPDFINKEGFVIKFSNGFRMKVKYEEYFRLHRIVTGINKKRIWEILSENKELPIDLIPDEFFQQIKGWQDELRSEYITIEKYAKETFASIYIESESRKEFALKALQYKDISGILFKIYTNQPYNSLIWKSIEPVSADANHFNSFRKSSQ
jgi:RNA ligase